MKNIRKFETKADRDAWLEGSEFVTPNVVLTDGQVEYNILAPSMLPLYIEAIENLTIKFGNTYEYSKDNSTWLSGTSSTSISASAGEKVYFRASGLTPDSSIGIGKFTISNGKCNVGGNIMSMAYGADFKGQTAIANQYQFYRLFYMAANIVDASKLILFATTLNSHCYEYMFFDCTSLVTAPALPATKLAENCYKYMFQNCTSLKAAPALPATNLASSCYVRMFDGCSKLNYIKAMFKSTPSAKYTTGWVDGVSSTGTFVKNSAATWDVIGENGIPEGWTVETASA